MAILYIIKVYFLEFNKNYYLILAVRRFVFVEIIEY